MLGKRAFLRLSSALSGVVLLSATVLETLVPGQDFSPDLRAFTENCRDPTSGIGATSGSPFHAIRTETAVRTLADGSTVTRRTTTLVARDSRGRVYSIWPLANANEDPSKIVQHVSLLDPSAEVLYTWATGVEPRVMSLTRVAGWSQAMPTPPLMRPLTRLENAMVNGLYAQGFRQTGTTPEGTEGNSRPIVHTQEWWCAPDLKIKVREVYDSLIAGHSTIELTDIVPSEPDPALFQLPEGYLVKENRAP